MPQRLFHEPVVTETLFTCETRGRNPQAKGCLFGRSFARSRERSARLDLALALARLGRWDAAVYDGSWAEWGSRDDTRVVTGE